MVAAGTRIPDPESHRKDIPMTNTYISLAFYVLGAALFISWFVVARGLGRDKSPEGSLADQRRRSRMQLLLGLGFAALLAGAAVAYIR
jgi:hypothetical protein